MNKFIAILAIMLGLQQIGLTQQFSELSNCLNKVAFVLDDSYSTKRYKNYKEIRSDVINFSKTLIEKNVELDVFTFSNKLKNIFHHKSTENVEKQIEQNYLIPNELNNTSLEIPFESKSLMSEYDAIIYLCSGPSTIHHVSRSTKNKSNSAFFYIGLGRIDKSIYEGLVDKIEFSDSQALYVPKISDLSSRLDELLASFCTKHDNKDFKSNIFYDSRRNQLVVNQNNEISELIVYDNIGRVITHSNGIGNILFKNQISQIIHVSVVYKNGNIERQTIFMK